MSASEGHSITAMTVKNLKSICTDDHFTAFWGLVIKAQQELDVCDPELPRRRKAPKRYDDGGPPDFLDDCQAHYRQSYYKALNLVVNAINDRFDHPDFIVCIENWRNSSCTPFMGRVLGNLSTL